MSQSNIIIRSLKKILGPAASKHIAPYFHGIRGSLLSNISGNPSKGLKIIAITGTKGKTSTTVLAGRLLNKCGLKCGYISTALICTDGVNEESNKYKMSNLGPVALVNNLKKIKNNNLDYLIIELSSEGLFQNRHFAVDKIDVGVFLNLYPEHIQNHGSLENYMKSKAKMFSRLKDNGVFIGTGLVKYNGNEIVDNQLEKTEFMFKNVKKSVKKIILTPGLNYKIFQEENSIYKSVVYNNTTINLLALADFEARNLIFSLECLKNINLNSFNHLFENNNNELTSILNSILRVPGRMDWVVVNGQVQ